MMGTQEHPLFVRGKTIAVSSRFSNQPQTNPGVFFFCRDRRDVTGMMDISDPLSDRKKDTWIVLWH